MTSTLDDEDLSMSISSPPGRRNSRESPATNGGSHHPPPSMPRIPHAPPKQPKQAERLGQYNVLRTLGEGSFGKVKLAVHAVSGQRVALKVMSRRKLVTRDMAGRIEREIQYLQLLRHPHIIKLYTVITMPNEIVMVLEYAGGELFDYIVQHGKMAEDKARKFFQQIVCAVEYCHRHKIVHRDLKPENLLLDEHLNVKIADFGLSNIMTDGNFLKTSCGSPNYAAPEVISGKLYAGPEVDVWSCGVILYVLLAGRLPFDDEYIPALFKKIAQGNYTVPKYLSSGAERLIRKMLQVNPVNRITIQEIRQDPWFTKDLADYLQPQVEDFIDTVGVDPNKAIDPHALGKGNPAAVQEKMHASIVGKLGKTMGYAPDDVQEALARNEPSAIKDAYLIVRENHLMKTNPSLAADQPEFVAQSPPAMMSSMPMSPRSPNVRLSSPVSNIDHPRQGSTGSVSKFEPRSPASTIAVLPSSLPDYHAAYMKGQMSKTTPGPAPDDLPSGERPRTKEEQEIVARRLKPHNKSSTSLQRYNDKPEPLTALPEKQSKKNKPQKWQFGIRSRNTPCEAMLAIYKALRKMGAVWEVPRPKEPGTGSGEGSPQRAREGSQSPEYSDSDPDPGTDPEYATHEEQEQRRRARASGSNQSGGGRGRERYGRWNDYGYDIPEDPWVIKARFRKDGMLPRGVAHPSSAHSSRADLQDMSTKRRTTSEPTSLPISANPSAAASTENMALAGPASGPPSGTLGESAATAALHSQASESVWVYVTIQLYSIEKDFYLVDFKCAGYERLVRRFARALQSTMEPSPDTPDLGTAPAIPGQTTYDKDETQRGRATDLDQEVSEAIEIEAEDDYDDEVLLDEHGERLVPLGRGGEEKEISSPFPFLDVASRLIIQLAEAND